MKNFIAVIAIFYLLIGCSNDADEEQLQALTIYRVDVDGVPQQFPYTGWNITLQPDGSYKQEIYAHGNTGDSGEVLLQLQYLQKGNNAYHHFSYKKFDIVYLPASDFVVDIQKNNAKQFKATFSGHLQNGGNSIQITNGLIHYVYDEEIRLNH